MLGSHPIQISVEDNQSMVAALQIVEHMLNALGNTLILDRQVWVSAISDWVGTYWGIVQDWRHAGCSSITVDFELFLQHQLLV